MRTNGDVRGTLHAGQKANHSQVAARSRHKSIRCNIGHAPEIGPSLLEPSPPLLCCICSSQACKKISHRIVQVESWRRVSKPRKSSALNTKRALEAYESSASAVTTSIHRTPPTPIGQLDSFITLPLKGITKTAMDQYYQYFTCQTRSVFDPNRLPGFDAGLLKMRFRQSIESSAMCASIITMAITLNVLRQNKLATPNADLLASYSVSLRVLRDEIEGINGADFSENTILAAISIATSCGIAFPDPKVALAHWQGVLALYHRRNPMMWSGAVIAWVDNFEWWLTVLADLRPRDRPWPTLVLNEKPATIETYGKAFRPLFDLIIGKDDSASKQLTSCLNMCRGVEMLESLAKQQHPKSNTYFDYLRLVLMNQITIVSSLVNGTGTLAECINITVVICFMMLLRVLPYYLPLRHLCSRLQAITTSYNVFEMCKKRTQSISTGAQAESCDEPDQAELLLQNAHVWMLGICVCAARLSEDRQCYDWAISTLEDVYTSAGEHMGVRRVDLLRRMRLFCWSDDFLAKYLVDIDL